VFKKIHVFRVKPGLELLAEISKYCRQSGITSGVILGIIGSTAEAKLNFLKALPGKYDTHSYTGPIEIVAAQGTVALKGKETIIHIHIQLSSDSGCFGGHLAEAKIFSTAEVVIGELPTQLTRYADTYTGLNELQ
jgi:predicted DNA-binding protein with PD1-like motif